MGIDATARHPGIEPHLCREVWEEDAAAFEPPPLRGRSAAHQQRMNRALVQAWWQQVDLRPVQVLDGELDQLSDRGRLGAGHEGECAIGSGLIECEDRARHVADRHDVDGRGAAPGHGAQRARGVRAQRCVDHVERRGPAAQLVADDDAGAEDLDGQPLPVLAYHMLGLPLRALVRVVKALPEVQIALAEDSAVVAGDVGGRHVREAPQSSSCRAMLSELQHAARARYVHGTGVLERQSEGDGRCRVDHLVDAACDLLAPAGVKSETRLGEVRRHSHDPVEDRLGVRHERCEDRTHPLVRGRVAAGANQRPHPSVAALEQSGQQLHAQKAGGSGEQDVAAGADAGRRRREHLEQRRAPGAPRLSTAVGNAGPGVRPCVESGRYYGGEGGGGTQGSEGPSQRHIAC